MTPIRRALVGVLTVATLAGCGQSVAGTPSPAEPTGQDDGIVIDNPRDLAAVADDPCALLTQAQLDRLSPGLVQRTKATVWGETGCIWDNDAIWITVDPDTTTGMGVDVKLLQPGTDRVEVVGYPGAHYGDASPNFCTVSVGVADDVELIVGYSRGQSDQPEHLQACPFVDSIAAMVIENLPPQE